MTVWVYADNTAIDATRPVRAELEISERFITVDIKDHAVKDLNIRIELRDIKKLLEQNNNG